MRARKQCPDCGFFSSNETHTCTQYDDSQPCSVCGAGTVFVVVAAPGTGSGRCCRNGHFHGTSRELTFAEVR